MSKKFALALHDIGAVQFGSFKLKSGLVSPIYIDMRLLVSHPVVLEQAADLLFRQTQKLVFDRIAAIPYAGLPIGVAYALRTRKPMIYTRREAKEHGTRRLIEGEYKSGERVLLIDDVLTRGESKLESITPLQEAGLRVTEIAVMLDRESGGTEMLTSRGFHITAGLNLTELLEYLVVEHRIEARQRDEILAWLHSTR